MDSARFENANKLHDAGRIEDAAREFHALADETDDPMKKRRFLQTSTSVIANLVGWIRRTPLQSLAWHKKHFCAL
jgi:hypothetical protein